MTSVGRAGARIVIAGVVSLTLLGGWMIDLGSRNDDGSRRDLRVAFPTRGKFKEYDPVKIHFAPEYIFLETIYSPLVEYSITGDIVGGVASDFGWIGNDAIFSIRSGLLASDGLPITAEDVAFSLKRVIVLSGNTHGRLKDLVCWERDLASVDDDCPGIVVENERVVLRLRAPSPFLIPMLTAIDFAIIPRRAVDLETLEIKDYSITSGPYFVRNETSDGGVLLALNEMHYRYSSHVAKQIRLVPSLSSEESLRLILNGEVDFLSTIDSAAGDAILGFFEKTNKKIDFNIHQTLPLRTFTVTFTPKGMRRFSDEERFAIGIHIKRALGSFFAQKPGVQVTDQLFPDFGEGGLTQEQKDILNKSSARVGSDMSDLKIVGVTLRLGNAGPISLRLEEVFKDIQLTESESLPTHTTYRDSESEPDFELHGCDTGFTEDISLLSYAISTGMMAVQGAEGDAWLRSYMAIEDKDTRLAMLRELHLKTILNGYSIPIATSPYVAISRRPWVPVLSKFFANNPLWQVQLR